MIRKRAIRGFLIVSVLAFSVAGAAPNEEQPSQTQSCSASTGVGLSGVSGATCTFALACDGSCIYAFTLDGNGTGSVDASVTATQVFGDEHSWSEPTGASRGAPACSGTFSCSDRASLVLRESPDSFGIARLDVMCTASGVALFESVSCTATMTGAL